MNVLEMSTMAQEDFGDSQKVQNWIRIQSRIINVIKFKIIKSIIFIIDFTI